MALIATALACMVASTGCAHPPPSATFAISYERSGGLAPMPQKLVIAPGRRATLTIQKAPWVYPKIVHFRVGVKRVERLRRALARAGFGTIEAPAPSPTVCADCFFYAIGYRGHEVNFSQAQEPKRLRGVMAQIEAVIAAH